MVTLKSRQRGLSLIQVAIVMATLAAIAMAALMSMRAEHNYFTDLANKLLGKPSAAAGADAASAAAVAVVPAAPAGVLRKCTINGKTVYSDVDCQHGQSIKAIDSKGIEAPKVPKADPAASGPQSATDKMIEKATQ